MGGLAEGFLPWPGSSGGERSSPCLSMWVSAPKDIAWESEDPLTWARGGQEPGQASLDPQSS